MSNLYEQCEEFARLWQANAIAERGRCGYSCTKRVKERQKWICIDQDNGPDSWSGMYMVRKADGIVYGIKGYGVPHLQKNYGHITWLIEEQKKAQRARQGGQETASVSEGKAFGQGSASVGAILAQRARQGGQETASVRQAEHEAIAQAVPSIEAYERAIEAQTEITLEQAVKLAVATELEAVGNPGDAVLEASRNAQKYADQHGFGVDEFIGELRKAYLATQLEAAYGPDYEASITDRPAKPRKVTEVKASTLHPNIIVTYYKDGGYSERWVTSAQWQAQRDRDCGSSASVGLTAAARNILVLLDGVDVAAHTLGGLPHLPEEPWLKAKAELWAIRKQLLQALTVATPEDLKSLKWSEELSR